MQWSRLQTRRVLARAATLTPRAKLHGNGSGRAVAAAEDDDPSTWNAAAQEAWAKPASPPDTGLGGTRGQSESKYIAAEQRDLRQLGGRQVEVEVEDVAKYGVRITYGGRMHVEDPETAKIGRPAVLVVGGVATGVWSRDFYRLARPALEGEKHRGGLINAIVARDPRTLAHLPRWILQFESPYHASVYQRRLFWYERNMKDNAPGNLLRDTTSIRPITGPPPAYLDPANGEDVWRGVHEYALSTRPQSLDVQALLPPFEKDVSEACEKYEKWNMSRVSGRCWSVRVFVEEFQIGHVQICNIARSLPMVGKGWELVEGSDVIQALGSDGQDLVGDVESDSWLIRFKAEKDALSFWRTWHRKPLANPEGDQAHQVLVQVEPLW